MGCRPRLAEAMSAVSVTNGNGTASAPPAGVVAPPHNLEAEQSVLGSILLSDRSLYALGDRRGAARRGLLPRAPRHDLRGDARALQRVRAGRRAHGHRPPALQRQARGRRRGRDGRRADRGRAGRRARPPLRADRARERAAAAAAGGVVRDPGERARPSRRAARARRAGREGDARGRAATIASRTSARSKRSSTRSSTSCTASRSRAPR